ncbi:MAG TPA: SAM-dependent methyltransferase [Nitrosarchaeum sp.]|nr:SAM-dependent methyltransferase [Nitrosarchaeum sp.]
MGVPGLFPFVRKYYGETVSEFGLGEKIVKCDYLHIDANSILHGICQLVFHYGEYENKKDEYEGLSLEEKRETSIRYFFAKIESLQTIFPCSQLTLSLDGPAPVAKQCQQRQRRFVSAMNRKGDFDSNCLTSGTEYIYELTVYLHYKIRHKLNTELKYKNIKILFSSPFVPGEGEHKIMDYIREYRNVYPEKTHIVLGPDADLIILCMALQIKNVYLIRESHEDKQRLFMIDISLLCKLHYEYIISKAPDIPQVSSDFKRITLKQCVDDFVLQSVIVGNDFLPKIKMFYHLADGLNFMTDIYKGTIKKILTVNSVIEYEPFKQFIKVLADSEEKYIRSQIFKNQAVMDFKLQDKLLLSYYINQQFDYKGYKQMYYKKAGINAEGMKTMCVEYMRGLSWVLIYYTCGLPSWDWYYGYHYAPFMEDVLSVLRSMTPYQFEQTISFKDKGSPKSPIFQLMCVIPASSKDLLPVPFDMLLTAKSKELQPYFPTDFEIDYQGKTKDYMGVAVIPFVNNLLFKKWYDKMYPLFLKKYTNDVNTINRDTLGENILLERDAKITVNYFSQIGNLEKIHIKRTVIYLSSCVGNGLSFHVKYSTLYTNDDYHAKVLKFTEERMSHTLFCDKKLVKQLWKEKNRMDKIFDEGQSSAYYQTRNKFYPQDEKGSSVYKNRAGDKLLEVINQIDLFENVSETSAFLDICGGPGAFSQLLLYDKKRKGFGITLKTKNEYWYPELQKNAKFTIIDGEDGTGNVYDPKNLDQVVDVIRETKIQIVVADGGFEIKKVDDVHMENFQELYSGKIIISEVYLMSRILQKGGVFVCKLFDTLSTLTISIIYVLCQMFEEVWIVKPYRSRAVNSERYIACKNRLRSKNNDKQYIKLLSNAYDLSTENTSVESLVKPKIVVEDVTFLNSIKNMNESLIKNQTGSLKKILDAVESSRQAENPIPQKEVKKVEVEKKVEVIKEVKTVEVKKEVESTSVVCVKVDLIRKKGVHDLKEWTKNPNNVYIGRKGVVFVDKERFPKKDSPWANPYKVGAEYTREESIKLYEKYIVNELDKGEKITVKDLLALKGKTLGCWCKPEPCHGDVLVKLIEKYSKE